jgi:uncharacterized membrane protein
MTDLQQIAFVMLATVGVACLAATYIRIMYPRQVRNGWRREGE